MTKPMLFTLLIAALGACGSDDPITAIDRDIDCAKICDTYRDCADSNYNVDGCEDRCQDMVSNKDTARIDDCQACIKGNSCVGSAFECASDCAGIVP